ncbi:hypothetical protein GCM10023169_22480 [Georgenia halophila]|uniref:GNAT family N-acetyltransferase n=1 Tax=Georgenia halophila TaxID=620889 RepID=A0ABP8LA72_9MICO
MGARCQCQRYKLQPGESFAGFPVEERAARLREQTEAGHPCSGTTSGLIAYLAGEPAGWCAVEPRTVYHGLLRVYRVPWDGRDEDDGGARALEGYPMTTTKVVAEELHVGTVRSFADAGFTEASRPTTRRVVMRIELR